MVFLNKHIFHNQIISNLFPRGYWKWWGINHRGWWIGVAFLSEDDKHE